MTATLEPVAVIDDVALARDDVMETLRATKRYEPIAVDVAGLSISEVVDAIAASAGKAVCDQRLDKATRTPGAAYVTEMTRRRLPSILYSEQKNENLPELRHFLPAVPRFYRRTDLHTLDIAATFAEIAYEFEHPPKEKREYRTLLRVVEIRGHGRIAVIIPAWNADEQVEISTDDIEDSAIRKALKSGTRLFARSNLHAEDSASLFFEGFEIAGDLDPNDGLA